MSKYSKEVKELLEYIGGEENVNAVSHCATRMRFVLNDTSIADEEKIKKIKFVKGTFTQAGQFQVIGEIEFIKLHFKKSLVNGYITSFNSFEKQGK